MIEAIPTTYDGHRFRSRIEARWARFLTTLQLPYDYEKEGFALKSGNYLPDFWLPKQNRWLEIKPGNFRFGTGEGNKIADLAEAIDSPVHVFCGGIPKLHDGMLVNEIGHEWANVIYPERGVDCPHYWCRCPRCGAYGIEFDGRSERMNCCEAKKPSRENTATEPTILRAYAAARSARFEHGETP